MMYYIKWRALIQPETESKNDCISWKDAVWLKPPSSPYTRKEKGGGGGGGGGG